MEKLFKDLEYAKNATKSCLENSNTLVDMHGLSYWATQVENLRNKIKEEI